MARTLGINGLGRIGKLTLWYHLTHDDFDGLVVNLGRGVGKSLEDLLDYLVGDSTYGSLHRYLGGIKAQRDTVIEDRAAGKVRIHGKPIQLLMNERNPAKLPWREHGVQTVVDCTGAFVDPTVPGDAPKGSLRGHLEGGARSVLQSSAFKVKSGDPFPDDSVMLINGVNHHRYDPTQHAIISAASCTTTGLAHMMKPLLDRDETSRILTAGMSTIHAATNSQSVLDTIPKDGAKDLRKTRMALNNVILTSTGAAQALEHVIPEIRSIGFMADSVRIPTPTVSLIILNITFQTTLGEGGKPALDRAAINKIYEEAAEESQGLVRYTEQQNVSADMVGEDAAIVIEAADTHTRTGFLEVSVPAEGGGAPRDVRVPVTHVKIFGWYDNELGSYTNQLGRLTRHVAGV